MYHKKYICKKLFFIIRGYIFIYHPLFHHNFRSNYIYLFILFIRQIPYPATAGSAHNNAKKRQERKNKEKTDRDKGYTIFPNQPRQLIQ